MTLETPSPNFGPRPDGTPIDMVVLHYTGMPNQKDALDRLCDPAAQVSAHYLIGEDGALYRLVAENMRAWHAGVSFWRGEKDINSRSIGIELVNPGHEFGYRSFPNTQMATLKALLRDIFGRYPIPARNLVGHSDIAPTRKTDPGELFDWAGLAEAGFGLWPMTSAPADPTTLADDLSRYGYDATDANAALAAFQRHFHPQALGAAPNSDTAGRLKALLALAEMA